MADAPLVVGGTEVPPGASARLELPVARLFTGAWMGLPVAVVNGRRPGPRLWIDAAIHGDEVNGMEIIRRVLPRLDPETMVGTVIAVPAVNVFGLVQHERYLPDRRDLNRSFPGSPRGSLAARLAHLFLTEVVARCGYGIDLHTGSNHRVNLPQVRAELSNPEIRRLATAFGAPMMYEAPAIAGTLRAVARQRKLPYILYEAGEPLRFDDDAIHRGVLGVLRVLEALGMRELAEGEREPLPATFEAGETRWVRAPRSGIFRLGVELGERVLRHQELGEIGDPFWGEGRPVRAPFAGMVIGYTANPLVHQGGALIHLARASGAPPLRRRARNGRPAAPRSTAGGGAT